MPHLTTSIGRSSPKETIIPGMTHYDQQHFDSKEPFLTTGLVLNSPVCIATANHVCNGSNHHHQPDMTSCLKVGVEDAQALRATVSKLRVWLLALTAVSFSGFLTLIVVVACLFASLNYDLAHHTHKPKVGEQIAAILEKQELCIPCEDLRLGPSPEEDNMLKRFMVKDSSAGLRCCVDQPMELLDLLKMHVERRIRQEVAKGTINTWPKVNKEGPPIKSAAHLLMAPQDMHGIPQVHGRQYTVGKWIHNDDLAFTYNTTYRHGRIVIPEDGFYFVYSQISFLEVFDLQHSESYSSKAGSDFPSLSHYLYRYNIQYHNGGEEKLAQNSITKCWGQSKTFGEYTSNLGAVFYLRMADEIFVKVSNLTMVASDPKLSYFGLFKI